MGTYLGIPEDISVGVKIGYEEINVRKLPEQIFSCIKIERSRKTKKTTKGLMVSSSKRMSWIDRGIQLGRSPSWINHGSSSAPNQSSLANGWAGSTTDSAWPFGKLDQSSSANGRAELTKIHLHLFLVTPLPRLYQTRSCFVSIRGIVGTLLFKNRKNSFSRITFVLIV